MALFLIGLIVFLAIHSTQIFASDARAAFINKYGDPAFKGVYSVISIASFIALIFGFGAWREAGIPVLWQPPVWTRHLAYLLMIPAFVALVATYVPGKIKTALKHPMLVAIKIWALAHLLANGDLASLLLFGGFLIWAILDRISVKRRVGGSSPPAVPAGKAGDVVVIAGGIIAYVAFILYLHGAWIGISLWPIA